jgi:hypothetical protein
MQMLGLARQTGALHINSGETDALLFFDGGSISHAECGALFGDEAVIHILKSCFKNNSGVYKFVYASASAQRTVLRSPTDLMLDAMREVDESAHQAGEIPSLQAAAEETPATPAAGPDTGDATRDVAQNDACNEPSDLAVGLSHPAEPVASASADSAPETEEPSLLHRMDSFDDLPQVDLAALANQPEHLVKEPEGLADQTETAANEPGALAGLNENELFSGDPSNEIVNPVPQTEISSAPAEVGEAHSDANEMHEANTHQAIESGATNADEANIAEANEARIKEANDERIDETNEAAADDAFEAASDDNESGIRERGEVYNYPPSEGYFFADRKPAEAKEAPATTSDDFSAISDALDRFAIKHSNNFSAATAVNYPGIVPSLDDLKNESFESETSFDDVGGTDLHQKSAAAPATPNSEVPATEDPSVATRSEEGL